MNPKPSVHEEEVTPIDQELPDEALPDGERSHVDGSVGIDNRIDGKTVPEPPDTLTPEQERQRRHDKRMPDQRKADIV